MTRVYRRTVPHFESNEPSASCSTPIPVQLSTILSVPIFRSDKHLATYSPCARAETRIGFSRKPVVTAATLKIKLKLSVKVKQHFSKNSTVWKQVKFVLRFSSLYVRTGK